MKDKDIKSLEHTTWRCQYHIVLLEQIRTIDKRRLDNYLGRLNSQQIKGINHALAVSVGLIEKTPENLIMCLCPGLCQ